MPLIDFTIVNSDITRFEYSSASDQVLDAANALKLTPSMGYSTGHIFLIRKQEISPAWGDSNGYELNAGISSIVRAENAPNGNPFFFGRVQGISGGNCYLWNLYSGFLRGELRNNVWSFATLKSYIALSSNVNKEFRFTIETLSESSVGLRGEEYVSGNWLTIIYYEDVLDTRIVTTGSWGIGARWSGAGSIYPVWFDRFRLWK